jgi:2-C-methyl-D-erythritol 4-phosphate cytidylyltransferase
MADFSVIVTTSGGGSNLKVDGREALLRSVDLFVGREGVREVIVVFPTAELEDGKKRHGSHFAFTGVRVAGGGPGWGDQVAAGVAKAAKESSHFVIHDGARPVVPSADLDAVLEEASKAPSGAALVGELGGTLLEVDEGKNPIASESAKRYVQLLSPMVLTRKAAETVATTKKEPPASALRLVVGSPLNIRMNHAGDEKRVKAMIAIPPKVIKASDGPFGEAQW